MSDDNELLSVAESETLQQLKSTRGGARAEATAPEVPAIEQALQPAVELNEAAPSEAKIKIGEQEFNSQAEAFQYAQSLYERGETDKLINDAYRQGIQDAAQRDMFSQNVTQPGLPNQLEEEDFDTKFFADPKKFLNDYAEKIRHQVKQEAVGEMTRQQAEQNLWQEFFVRHPDLDGFREDCDIVLEREKDAVATMARVQGKEKAMDYLARKTRAKFQAYTERQSPKRELPNNSTRPTPSGGERVTQSNAEPEPLDFATELRKMRTAKNVRY